MKCPVCSDELERVTYEGMSVQRCGQCRGVLAGRQRVEAIKRTREKPPKQLMDEAAREANADTEAKVRCPRCRAAMAKQRLPKPASFHIDTCAACKLIWFDGGELARLQLTYEISPQGREAAEFQRRLAEMTPEQKQEFEENLARLPDSLPGDSSGGDDVVWTLLWDFPW